MPPRKKATENQSFESKLQLLEELVQKMEAGELNLSDTLNAYEQGMKLAKELTGELDAAEARMQELVDGKAVTMEDAP